MLSHVFYIVFGSVLGIWTNTAGAALNYSCNSDGDITIENPYKDTHLSVVATNSDKNCTASLLNEGATIFVTGCEMNKRIAVTMFEEEDPVIRADGIVKTSIIVHTVQCNEIPIGGINRTVIDESWVTNQLVTTQQAPITPSVPVDSFVYDPETGVQKEASFVGDSIMWVIEGPEDYIILPVNCTAYAGTSADSSRSLHIVSYGCSLNVGLITDFQYTSVSEKHILSASVYVFRWAESNDVSLLCSIMACPPTSSACDFFCGIGKRSVSDNWPMFADTRNRERRSRQVAWHATSEVTYRVYGPANIMILDPLTSRQTQLTSPGTAIFLTVYVLLSELGEFLDN